MTKRQLSIALILFFSICNIKMAAKLPFGNEKEFFTYVRNLSPKTLQSAKPLESFLDSVGKEHTDPVLVKGVNLYNSGKIDEAIKYFSKVSKNNKYSSFQREYAKYQLFHIANFGMLDSRYNGRPTNIDRSNAAKYGEYYVEFNKPSFAILAALYPLITTESIWPKNYWQHNYRDWDLDLLHSLLKVTCVRRDLKQFPFTGKENDGLILGEYANPHASHKIEEFMNSKKELPNIQILRKGIDLDLSGKQREAFNYFYKLANKKYDWGTIRYDKYADYQCWHILTFGGADPYYNGTPSNISRELTTPHFSRLAEFRHGYKGRSRPSTSNRNYLIISASLGKNRPAFDDYYLLKDLKYAPVYNDEYIDYVNSVLTTIFSNRGDKIYAARYYNLSDVENYDKLKQFEEMMDFEPYFSQMNFNNNNPLGIGLNSNQLFEKASELLPALPDLKFDKGYEWKDKGKLDGKINNYLLKSAMSGNAMALNTFIAYNLAAINSSTGISNKSAYNNLKRSRKLLEFVENLGKLPSLNRHKLIINHYKKLMGEVYSYHKEIYSEEQKKEERLERAREQAELARKEEKKRRRAELWGNIGMAVLKGVAEGLNTYSNIRTQKHQSNRHQSSGSNRTPSSSKIQRSSQQVWNEYLNPETFVYNYTHGLPTLPNSAQLGLTGSDAYAYDLQNNLQHRMQLADLHAQKETEKLLEDGMKQAQKEIENFATVHGREATEAEIKAIYAKYTQGYIDAYGEYVSDNIATNKNLGLGLTGRVKSKSGSSPSSSSSKNSTSKSSSTTGNKSTASNNTKGASSSSNKSSGDKNSKSSTGGVKRTSNSSGNDAHEQYKGGNINTNSNSYGDKIKNVSMAVKDGGAYRNVSQHGELFKKGSEHFVKIGGTYFKVNNTSGSYNSYIVYGAKAYYFNR